jgi:predicted MFS family arabinose efflux permease
VPTAADGTSVATGGDMTVRSPVQKSLDLRVLIASAAAYTIGIATNWMQPVLVVEILSVKGTTETSAGLIVAVEMIAVALSCAACAKIGRGVSFLTIALIGTIVAALGNVLSLVAPSHPALLAARVLCGIGEGAPYMVCNAALARIADPDRGYAQINVSTIVCGIVLIYIAPIVGHFAGGHMAYPTLLICSVVLLPALLLMPRTERYMPIESVTGKDHTKTLSIVVMSFGAFIFTMTYGALWSFCLVLGERTGLDAAEVTHALTVAVIFALAGSFLASVIGIRFGRVGPLGISLAIITIATVCISNTTHPTIFLVSLSVDMLTVYFLQPYFFGYAAAVDPSGRGPATLGAALFISVAVGPFLGGLLFERFGYSVIGWVAIVANSVSFAIFYVVDRNLARATRSNSEVATIAPAPEPR